LLGLAVAAMDEPAADRGPWRFAWSSSAPSLRRRDRPLVLDLTGLWAGPLCCHLLQAQGARVIKVENSHRPDGSRHRPAQFYDLLNAGKESVALDFGTASGLDRLRGLIAAADIVAESSRPRALRQLGLDAEEMVASVPGLTWVGITGYGRDEPEANWIAFGDDGGVAAGLSSLVAEPDGAPNFCADAIADPLTGLHAALAAWHCWMSGGGLVSVALRDAVAHCANFDRPANGMQQRRLEWQEMLGTCREPVAEPAARQPVGIARPLGADTAAILSEFGLRC
jgi:crotonobetainyl-CoA:carnitine CoA-transferase CaiB-like acyl-CoA transferase